MRLLALLLSTALVSSCEFAGVGVEPEGDVAAPAAEGAATSDSPSVFAAAVTDTAGSVSGSASGGGDSGMSGGGGMGGGMMGMMGGMMMGGMGGGGGTPAPNPAPAPEPGAPTVGAACTAADACPAGGSGTPVCLVDWPGGYCAVDACSDHGHDCPGDPGLGTEATSGAKCVLAPTPRCLQLCGADADCRSGYVCAARTDAAGHGSAKVCVPN